MDIYPSIVSSIIRHQEMVMGPLAITQAREVSGIVLQDRDHVTLTGDPKVVLNNLVLKFASIFGDTSIDVCKDAVNELTPKPAPDMLPDLLR